MLLTAGGVVSIVNVAPVELPAPSITIKVYIPSALIVSQLFIGDPFSVAVSLKLSVTLPE